MLTLAYFVENIEKENAEKKVARSVMSFLLSFFERMHGHLGWILVCLLFHPSYLFLRNLGKKKSIQHTPSALFASVMTCFQFFSGMALYPYYRKHLKREVFNISPLMGYLFERKEHLAFACALLSVLAFFFTRHPHKKHYAGYLYFAAFSLAFVVAVLGTMVSLTKSFS